MFQDGFYGCDTKVFFYKDKNIFIHFPHYTGNVIVDNLGKSG